MIVVVAGRRIDPPGAAVSRFPLANRQTVRRRVERRLEELGATVVVVSAACGSDLVALQAARRRGARTRVVLPYQSDWFLIDSVTDRPGIWKPLYEQVIAGARAEGDLVTLKEARGSDDAFRAANDAIIAEALKLARKESPKNPGAALAGLIIWEGAPRGPDDVTAHMRDRLAQAGARIVEALTL